MPPELVVIPIAARSRSSKRPLSNVYARAGLSSLRERDASRRLTLEHAGGQGERAGKERDRRIEPREVGCAIYAV